MKDLNYNRIKLIIWDLDDTFWKGTLSEGEVLPINDNISLVKDLTNRGIINSICSKNDYVSVEKKLDELGVNDYFVFKSINWTPKGKRIAQLIKDMGLQPKHCLFIDDNPININEAVFYSPKLNVIDPSQLSDIRQFVNGLPPKDVTNKRLKQYQVLELKHKAKTEALDNLTFLYDCKTQVEILYNCTEEIDRIVELVQRTNQLNFTKLRSSKEELASLLSDTRVKAGYVKVKDKYGDYGIVGFFAEKDNVLIHFLFSCRTIGQGIEQYVYSTLNYPKLNIVGDVVGHVDNSHVPDWINQDNSKELRKTNSRKSISCCRILFKGPCDISGLIDFLDRKNIISELTYGGKNGNFVEHHNHSINFLQFYNMNEEEKREWMKLPFNDDDMFNTKLFDSHIDIIFLSTILEPALAIYRNKRTGKKIAWGGNWNKPITDSKNWSLYLNKEIFTSDIDFSIDFLKYFSQNYEFLGRQTPDEYIDNLKQLMDMISPNTQVCLLLGSEIPYINNNKPFLKDRHVLNKEYNDAIRIFAKDDTRISLIDFTDFITSQNDYADRITHYSRSVYYKAAVLANELIEEVLGYGVKKSFFENMTSTLKARIHYIGHLFINYYRNI